MSSTESSRCLFVDGLSLRLPLPSTIPHVVPEPLKTSPTEAVPLDPPPTNTGHGAETTRQSLGGARADLRDTISGTYPRPDGGGSDQNKATDDLDGFEGAVLAMESQGNEAAVRRAQEAAHAGSLSEERALSRFDLLRLSRKATSIRKDRLTNIADSGGRLKSGWHVATSMDMLAQEEAALRQHGRAMQDGAYEGWGGSLSELAAPLEDFSQSEPLTSLLAHEASVAPVRAALAAETEQKLVQQGAAINRILQQIDHQSLALSHAQQTALAQRLAVSQARDDADSHRLGCSTLRTRLAALSEAADKEEAAHVQQIQTLARLQAQAEQDEELRQEEHLQLELQGMDRSHQVRLGEEKGHQLAIRGRILAADAAISSLESSHWVGRPLYAARLEDARVQKGLCITETVDNELVMDDLDEWRKEMLYGSGQYRHSTSGLALEYEDEPPQLLPEAPVPAPVTLCYDQVLNPMNKRPWSCDFRHVPRSWDYKKLEIGRRPSMDETLDSPVAPCKAQQEKSMRRLATCSPAPIQPSPMAKENLKVTKERLDEIIDRFHNQTVQAHANRLDKLVDKYQKQSLAAMKAARKTAHLKNEEMATVRPAQVAQRLYRTPSQLKSKQEQLEKKHPDTHVPKKVLKPGEEPHKPLTLQEQIDKLYTQPIFSKANKMEKLERKYLSRLDNGKKNEKISLKQITEHLYYNPRGKKEETMRRLEEQERQRVGSPLTAKAWLESMPERSPLDRSTSPAHRRQLEVLRLQAELAQKDSTIEQLRATVRQQQPKQTDVSTASASGHGHVSSTNIEVPEGAGVLDHCISVLKDTASAGRSPKSVTLAIPKDHNINTKRIPRRSEPLSHCWSGLAPGSSLSASLPHSAPGNSAGEATPPPVACRTAEPVGNDAPAPDPTLGAPADSTLGHELLIGEEEI
eukprot:gene5941-1059_t